MPVIPAPVILTTASQEYTEAVQIRGVLWEGATTAGDTCELVERTTGRLLFAGRATGTQTWEGIVLPMSAPTGLKLNQISAGRVIVYLAEPEGM